MPNVLCVYPKFPKTYWGSEYSMPLTGKRALLPPLGLLTIAALLPPEWPVRLCDLNLGPLSDELLDWADVVFLSGMLIQRESLLEVARRARARGKTTVAGGPYANTSADALVHEVDCVVIGEAEDLMPALCEKIASGELPPRMESRERPDVTRLPPPRYELLDVSAYNSMGLQWSRGCPFNCEFCDIIEIFGRKPRVKTAEQLGRELDAIYATGFRGSVFIVDDNFIGNKVEARRMLPTIGAWMRKHGDPFDLFTEASVNLAADDALIDAMVDAGFTAVFLGIETPSPEALRETQKLQNTAIDLDAGVRKLVTRGLEVMAGFIVGFDVDDAGAVERQREWIARSPIPLAMVGILTALPGTQLERRLRKEGRLLDDSNGDNFARPNFVTHLDEATLLEGYARLLAEVYSPEAFFARSERSIAACPRPRSRFRHTLRYGLACLVRSLVVQGIFSNYRWAYWRFMLRALWRTPARFPRAIGFAINGEHMIRYTSEDVLPRLRGAIQEARRAPRRKARTMHMPVLASA